MAGTVIASKTWIHKGGSTASVYGALPWTGAPGNTQSDWTLTDTGWTVRWPDGTVGCMRPPFATKEAAQAFADARPTFPGWQQD